MGFVRAMNACSQQLESPLCSSFQCGVRNMAGSNIGMGIHQVASGMFRAQQQSRMPDQDPTPLHGHAVALADDVLMLVDSNLKLRYMCEIAGGYKRPTTTQSKTH